jgi:hypothetical protein
MRTGSLASVFFLALSTAPFAAMACGGSTPPAQTAGTGGDADAGGGSTSTTPGATNPADDGGATTTTTATLADGGDLQGTKLQTSTSRHVETKLDAGAHGDGGHTPDPGRAPKDIMAIILARRDEFRACYDKELKKNPSISEGDLVIDWVIDPEGNPTDVRLNSSKSQITEAAVVGCVTDIIKKMKFSRSPRGFQTTTYYPFNFKRASGGKLAPQ